MPAVERVINKNSCQYRGSVGSRTRDGNVLPFSWVWIPTGILHLLLGLMMLSWENRLDLNTNRIANRARLHRGKFTNNSVRRSSIYQLLILHWSPSYRATRTQLIVLHTRWRATNNRKTCAIVCKIPIQVKCLLSFLAMALLIIRLCPAQVLLQGRDSDRQYLAKTWMEIRSQRPRLSNARLRSSQPRQQFMLYEAEGLTGFLSKAVLNHPITININKLSSNSMSFVTFV